MQIRVANAAIENFDLYVVRTWRAALEYKRFW
jgi:hypothetical protein